MSSDTKQEFHLTVHQDGALAVELLAETSALSRQAIKQAMTKGAVWLTRGKHTQRLRRAKRQLLTGDELHLYYSPEILDQSPTPAQLVADEKDYSVWNKPCGMWSQGSKWGDHCSITRWAEQHLEPQRSAYLVHRLDKAANGLILIAHTKAAAAALSKLFHDRKITKHYRATVEGQLYSSPTTITTEIDDRKACSHVSELSFDQDLNQSLLEIRIETGRKHQIRRHLSSIGLPIVGDRLYGTGDADSKEDLQLTSCLLQFTCPLTGEAKHYELPLR